MLRSEESTALPIHRAFRKQSLDQAGLLNLDLGGATVGESSLEIAPRTSCPLGVPLGLDSAL